jgi:hypothetical protein
MKEANLPVYKAECEFVDGSHFETDIHADSDVMAKYIALVCIPRELKKELKSVTVNGEVIVTSYQWRQAKITSPKLFDLIDPNGFDGLPF